MPELPEVETTVRGLARFLDGETLARVTTRRGDLRRPFPPDLVQVLTGARVTGMGRRAKYGLIHVDRGQTMVFHLGMSGRWRIDPEELEKHDHLVLETGSGHRLALCDPRRFGSVDLVATAALEQWPPFAALLLGEVLHLYHLWGMALIVVGIALGAFAAARGRPESPSGAMPAARLEDAP